MKMDQIKLSEEALSFKQCIADMTDMGSLIQSKSIFNYLSNLVYGLHVLKNLCNL